MPRKAVPSRCDHNLPLSLRPTLPPTCMPQTVLERLPEKPNTAESDQRSTSCAGMGGTTALPGTSLIVQADGGEEAVESGPEQWTTSWNGAHKLRLAMVPCASSTPAPTRGSFTRSSTAPWFTAAPLFTVSEKRLRKQSTTQSSSPSSTDAAKSEKYLIQYLQQ